MAGGGAGPAAKRSHMIAKSRWVLGGAISIALFAHGLGLHQVFDSEQAEMEGALGATAASLGNSFANLAAGVMTPEDATEVAEAVVTAEPNETVDPEEIVETTEPEQPIEPVETEAVIEKDTPQETELTETEETQPDETPETAEPVEQTEETQREETPETVEPVEQTVLDQTRPEEVSPVAAPEPLPAEVPLAPVEATETQPLEVAQPIEAAQPLQPETIETLEAVDENTSAVSRSLRPKPRTQEFEEKHEREEPPKQTAQPTATRQPQGNASENATAGSATRQQQQTSTAATGNAAVSNYPGQVMRRISRVSRPRVGSKGTAVVAFSVASNGGVASVSLARSSGSARLDQAALSMIRRAAPFPPPPPGAQRSFSIQVKGR